MSAVIPEIPPAIVQSEPDYQCLVHSCTECCRTYNPDGTPNVLGPLHQQAMTESFQNQWGETLTFLRCDKCPVHLKTFTRQAVDANGKKLYVNGKPLTEWELMKMEMDGSE